MTRQRRHVVLLRQLGAAALLAALLACGGGGDEAAPTAASDGRRFACDDGLDGCTEYTSASRFQGLGLGSLREICFGEWREGRCPTEQLLASCRDDQGDITSFFYVSETVEGFTSMRDVRRACDELGHALTPGTPPRVPGIEYPTLTVDADWRTAELTREDVRRVITGTGAYETPYDVYRVELVEGAQYTVSVRRPPEGGVVPDARDLRDVDPNGLDVQALHVWGPGLEWAEHDDVVGDDDHFIRVTARRSGPHAVMIESGHIDPSGVVAGVELGRYQVRVVRNAR